jgi:hypothetical protein
MSQLVAPLVASLLLSLGATAHAAEERSPRIFGGEPASVGEYPSLGLIKVVASDSQFAICTGALISPRLVLTAAHCISEKSLGLKGVAGKTTVAFDRMNVFDNSQGFAVQAKAVHVHPKYKGIESGHDIGLIELERDVNDREPMPYNADGARPTAETLLDLVGFGATDPVDRGGAGFANKIAGRAIMPCSDIGIDLPFDMNALICFDQRDEKGLCVGDSGGPVLATLDGMTTVVAVNSLIIDPFATAATPPTCNQFALSTRVTSELDFIEDGLAGEFPSSGGGGDGCGCRAAGTTRMPSGALLLIGMMLGGVWLSRRRAA